MMSHANTQPSPIGTWRLWTGRFMAAAATTVLLCAVLGAVSCATPTSVSLPSEHEVVIQTEWQVSCDTLQTVGVSCAWLVPEVFKWFPRDGPFDCGDHTDANGCFSSKKWSIKWNTQTPQVLRHEAGHAILYKLGHYCKRCWSLDGAFGQPGVLSLHPGKHCDPKKTSMGRYCQNVLRLHDG